MTRTTHLVSVTSAFLILCAIGAPWPTPDDLFYTGAAMNLSQGGALENVFIAPWMAPLQTNRFYIHPPLPSYVMAAWLDVFGISSVSLRAFQWTACAIALYSLDRFLHRFSVPRFTRAVVEILLLAALFSRGLRFEPLAFAFMFAGLAAVGGSWLRLTAGLFLVGCAVQTIPWLLVVAAPLGMALHRATTRWREIEPRVWLRAITSLSIAAASGLLLFGVLINFDMRGFATVFSRVMGSVNTGPEVNLGVFVDLVTRGWQPVLLAPSLIAGAACAAGLFVRPAPLVSRCLAIGVIAAAGLATLVYAVRALPFVFVFAWLLILLWLDVKKRSPAIRLALAAMLASSQATTAASWLLFKSSQQDVAAIREQIGSLPPHNALLVDSVAARFVFDYRLPAGAVSWEFSRPIDGGYPRSQTERAPGTIWVIQRNNELMGLSVPWVVFGRTVHSVHVNPTEIQIVK